MKSDLKPMNTPLCAAFVGMLIAVGTLTAAAPASADNSNSNSNTNDVTQINNPSSSNSEEANADETIAWPPTDLGWPPSAVTKAASGDGSKNNAAAKPIVMPSGQDGPKPDAATPIVMPEGQSAPVAAVADSSADSATTQPSKPIVPVDGG